MFSAQIIGYQAGPGTLQPINKTGLNQFLFKENIEYID